MGIKHIVEWLNQRGIGAKTGNAFFGSFVHRILTSETYIGTHYFNRTDSRTGKEHPKEEWIAVPVPPIITAEQFKKVQATLFERRPSQTPPRLTTSEVLLTGLARCAACGSNLLIRTGKSGRYRYYVCAGNDLKGRTACKCPTRIPEGELDGLVIDALASKLLTPERLSELLRQAYQHQREMASDHINRRSILKRRRKESETQIERMHTALAEGMVPDSSLFRDKLNRLLVDREEIINLASRLQTEAPSLRRALSRQQAHSVAEALKNRLRAAPTALKRRYVRGLFQKSLSTGKRLSSLDRRSPQQVR